MQRRGLLLIRFAVAGALVATTALGLPQQASSSSSTPTALPTRTVGGQDHDACGEFRPKANGKRWRCSFVDNFSGRALDGSKWMVGTTAATGFRMGSSCLMAQNVQVRRGALRVTASDEGRTFYCRAARGGSFPTRFTGGHLTTHQRFFQTYGMFEVRARFPKTGGGVRGAFWMYPERLTYGRWPRSGEIDVAEWWSHQPETVIPSLHYVGSFFRVDSGSDCTVADATQYHVYTVIWTRQLMTFQIDGTTCFSRVWTPFYPLVRPQPFDHPFDLVLTMGVDRLFGANPETVAANLPATLQVDYAKAWR